MLSESMSNNSSIDLFEDEGNCYSLKRCLDSDGKLSVIQVLNTKGQLYKCLFFDDKERLANVSLYNITTGKEIKNATFRSDGKTISSIREYDPETYKLLSVTFFKEDGLTVSSTVEYSDSGMEVQFSLYCDDGEIITQCI